MGFNITVPEKAVHNKEYLRDNFDLTQLKNYNRTEILHMLKTYFKLLVVRHPFYRLASGYRDKFAGNNTNYERDIGAHILRKFHPHLSEEVIKKGKGVTFCEYIQYITSDLKIDRHFAVYQAQCFPCLVQYDYIAKLETQAVDAPYIINNKLSGYGADALDNVHSNCGGATEWKRLPEYESLSAEDMDTVTAMYTLDMHMFGYSVHRTNGTLYGHCGNLNSKQNCC